jgi:hypothetical protein
MFTNLARRFLRMPEGSGPRATFPVENPIYIEKIIGKLLL